jgi:hypothetical protein
MAATLEQLKKIINDILILTLEISALHGGMREILETHQEYRSLQEILSLKNQKKHIEPTEQQIKEEKQENDRQQKLEEEQQKIIAQHEGLLDYLISTFPPSKENETSLLDQLSEKARAGKDESEKLDIIVRSHLEYIIRKFPGAINSATLTASKIHKAFNIYYEHKEYGSDSSANHFPSKGQIWALHKDLSNETVKIVTQGDVTRHFEQRECFENTLEKIENEIWWASVFHQQTKLEDIKKIDTFLRDKFKSNDSSLMTDIESFKTNNANLHITSRLILDNLIIELKIINSDVKVNHYHEFQNNLLEIKNKIASSKNTKKIKALSELVTKCDAITPDEISKAEISKLAKEIIEWKNTNQAVLSSHKHGADIGLTNSQELVNNLIDSLEPIALDNDITQYCEYQKYFGTSVEKIQNKIWWLSLTSRFLSYWTISYLLTYKFVDSTQNKLSALKSLLTLIQSINSTTAPSFKTNLIQWKQTNNATLNASRFTATKETESQMIVKELSNALEIDDNKLQGTGLKIN